MTSPNVYVLGVGMTKFVKPRGEVEYTELGFEAGVKAMLDAHITYDDVDTGIACFIYSDSCSGQRVFYQFGMTGIPIYNTNNNCATGSTGLYLARNLIKSGASNCVLVCGFETMKSGSPGRTFHDRPDPIGPSAKLVAQHPLGSEGGPMLAFFGNAGREYMQKYGATASDFAEIARVNHKHSVNNPYSQFRNEYSLAEVENSQAVYNPLTKLQCSANSDGGAAAVLVSQTFLDSQPESVKQNAILIAGQSLATDTSTLLDGSAIGAVGYGMSSKAAAEAFKEAGIYPRDVQVCELHDCFSSNEMVTLEALGLAEEGKAYQMVRNGDITHGGRVLVNPSGGLISKGHPIGATGLAQCAELVWHLRGWANNRLQKTSSVRHALQHNLGLGGAAVCAVYKRPDGSAAMPLSSDEICKRSGVGYNPAVEAKGFTHAQAERVCSQRSRNLLVVELVQERVLARF
ncbi:thiolase-like protein [Polyplosphaeria fusca]|uniref:propanoyl-CoA C-acyltransferase n=1 Tax=Polyplosphaeria fusca TaxID=682080 RepID=A0A9P4QLB9_9PLEO|nr:thiolase-like protein [Polyplosphaeria fusca]